MENMTVGQKLFGIAVAMSAFSPTSSSESNTKTLRLIKKILHTQLPPPDPKDKRGMREIDEFFAACKKEGLLPKPKWQAPMWLGVPIIGFVILVFAVLAFGMITWLQITFARLMGWI